MGELLSYMLKSSLILIALYLTYKCFMANQKEHVFNRITLLAIYLMAFLIPALPAISHAISTSFSASTPVSHTDVSLPFVILSDDTTPAPSLIPFIIVCTYLIGVLAMIALTAISYIRLIHIIMRGKKIQISPDVTLVISDKPGMAPFSWMKYIVMSQNDYDACGAMVMTHELEHLAQRHWIDMVLAQAVIILQWFNPAAWLLRDELRAVHEFQADAAVLCSGADARQYQLLLIKKAVGKSFPALANSLNHSKLKKRITMMLKSKPRKSRRMLALALAPAAVAAVAVFNIPAVAAAFSTVANAKIPENYSEHKVTKSVEQFAQQTEENTFSEPEEANDAPATVTSASVWTPETKETSADKTPMRYIITINGKEVTPDADGKFEYNGQQDSVNTITNVSPEDITSMNVNRQESTITINLRGNEAPAKTAKKMPQFPGGDKALLNYVCENIHYPAGAPQDGKTHRVVVSFNISSTGKVGEAKVLRSQGELFDAEALRVVSTLPDFEPAVDENGENVSVMYALPISFKTTGTEETK